MLLIVVVTGHIAAGAVAQDADPGEVSIGLRRTPPVTVVANAAERTTTAAVTTRKTCKAGSVIFC